MRRIRESVRQDRRDDGMTLIELIVAIGIFTLVLIVFMGGVVMMTRGTVRADVTAASGDSTRLAFQRMEREVRYAESVNYAGTGGGGRRYVEFRTGAAVSSTGSAMCTQWRWDPATGELQSRTWPDVPTPTVPAWSTLITDVLADDDHPAQKYPFEVLAADKAKNQPRQRLVMRLSVGNEGADARVASETTFVARNSSTGSVSNADEDKNGQSDTQVCVAAVGRP
jgi:prepilin-type N-terminal cleavage/methylation domain-containing protein